MDRLVAMDYGEKKVKNNAVGDTYVYIHMNNGVVHGCPTAGARTPDTEI